jgi:hypothetical protein
MFNWLTPGVGAALGGAAAGLFGYKGAKEQNVASAQQAQNQMDFQERMSNTAVQRRMADLQKAGINPILAGSKEASSPAGAMAPQFNKAQAALQNASSATAIGQSIAQIQKTMAETAKLGFSKDQNVDYQRLWNWFFDSENWFNKDNYSMEKMFPALYNNTDNSAEDVNRGLIKTELGGTTVTGRGVKKSNERKRTYTDAEIDELIRQSKR